MSMGRTRRLEPVMQTEDTGQVTFTGDDSGYQEPFDWRLNGSQSTRSTSKWVAIIQVAAEPPSVVELMAYLASRAVDSNRVCTLMPHKRLRLFTQTNQPCA